MEDIEIYIIWLSIRLGSGSSCKWDLKGKQKTIDVNWNGQHHTSHNYRECLLLVMAEAVVVVIWGMGQVPLQHHRLPSWDAIRSNKLTRPRISDFSQASARQVLLRRGAPVSDISSWCGSPCGFHSCLLMFRAAWDVDTMLSRECGTKIGFSAWQPCLVGRCRVGTQQWLRIIGWDPNGKYTGNERSP